MTWKIKPLEGKYYGTHVVNDTTDELIIVWLPLLENYCASVRELRNGWTKEDGFDHVETQRTYEVALIICEALNENLK